MRKPLAVAVLCLCAGVFAGAGMLFGESTPKKGDTITVSVMNAKVMEKPKILGKAVTPLSRGDKLTVESASGAWFQVKTKSGQSGYVHRSNVRTENVSLSSEPGKAGDQVSEKDQELAARGFSKDIESEYRSKHGDLVYDHIDAIEKLETDQEKVGKFAEAGKVGGGL